MSLRQDIEQLYGTVFRASVKVRVPSQTLYQMLNRYEAGGKLYLSSRLLLAKVLGMTLRQFEKKYCNYSDNQVQ